MSNLLAKFKKVIIERTTSGSEGLNNDEFTLACKGTNIENYTGAGDKFLTLDDAGKLLRFTDTGLSTIRVPPDDEVNFPIGTKIQFTFTDDTGAANLSVFAQAGSPVVVESLGNGVSPEKANAVLTVTKQAENLWYIDGDISGLGTTLGGRVTNAGAISFQSNSNVTAARVGVGRYEINIGKSTTSFISTFTAVGNNDTTHYITGTTIGRVTVQFSNSLGAAVDTDFEFNIFTWA